MTAKMEEYVIWGKPEYSAKKHQVEIPYVALIWPSFTRC